MQESSLKISSKNISETLYKYHNELLPEFYEMQSNFLTLRYNWTKNIEVSNILTFLVMSTHLSILRKRERNLDYNVSFNNFAFNQNTVMENGHNIVSIVKSTGIPKESVRRKVKKLVKNDNINYDKNTKKYFWELKDKKKNNYLSFVESDIKSLSKFITFVANFLSLNLKQEFVEKEIKSNFSFYYYHYYNCQVKWMKMWKKKIKDLDLIFIAIQALIPTLKSNIKNKKNNDADSENIHLLIGENGLSNTNIRTISASSISEISGIPRATCIRKIQKLEKLGMLAREEKTKRYFINQRSSDRTKHITKKENIHFTIDCFSDFFSIVLSALARR